MHKNSCPHCHTRSGLYDHSLIVLSLENWPQTLLSAALVIAFAEKFALTGMESLVFIVFAAIPTIVSTVKKTSCDNCGIEFRSEEHEKHTAETSDLY